jgi:hypothetical protein
LTVKFARNMYSACVHSLLNLCVSRSPTNKEHDPPNSGLSQCLSWRTKRKICSWRILSDNVYIWLFKLKVSMQYRDPKKNKCSFFTVLIQLLHLISWWWLSLFILACQTHTIITSNKCADGWSAASVALTLVWH